MMASLPIENQETDGPIVHPLLRNDPYSLSIHEEIYQQMHNCVTGSTEKRVLSAVNINDTTKIWSPARELDQKNASADNPTNIANKFIPNYSDGRNISAIERLAEFAQKIYTENSMDEKYYNPPLV